ncbi:MAG: 50S ribosomal protein L19 [Candidatus Brennerbacteria bacterium RIFOXYC1_FULL_41_11]|uniref:50S ribosomal protein L19 n=1 Tax=Candidatus Brennerbacteria bacterium RIFOXYD1_FULL_41_16 TaxID=1797529 RepID=A0A1G1XK77_9BACT|nr:MAG: 50S ribosomal protein L19 [Candidatus Brennerbacteria bacterium RIFOXYB1_FULL_41_13]OGY39221.1 MAG: 50S ribosomal protein L19 [Candidatus Brennerbacteria bacterium RIFOXYC1_FULL_41_11]OGY40503.1 MAG: 50S ribosomal protein L19 [Candidatus Brennerbacteria bacterium RIFOXYD1_FULL_41_16]
MNNKVLEIHKSLAKTNLPEIKSGMKVKVWYKIKEGEKWRTTYFEGIVIAVKHGLKTLNSTFTVRKIAVDNVGVDMTWPTHSPIIEKINILQTPKVRRAKVYYLRERSRKQVRAKLKNTVIKKEKEETEEKQP